MSEEKTTKSKANKVTIKQFLGIISIDAVNKFAAEKMYANNTEEKTPSAWHKELSKHKDLNYTYNS